jgi:hypothetical protein
MISIRTEGDLRIYTAPRAVWDVALDLFAGEDMRDAGCQLMRELSMDELHTVECIALNVGHLEAVQYASGRLANRTAGKGTPGTGVEKLTHTDAIPTLYRH